jgi:hypothetical protein
MGQGAVIAAPTELTKFEQKLDEKIKKEVSRIQR